MEFTRCFRCMEVAERYPCPHCGYDPSKDKIADYVLPPQTILNGKYVVGTPLGQGGFGITYVGWDLALDCKVAIKEYYPAGQVVRDNATGSALRWLTTPQSQTAKEAGKEMFLKEARKMTRVRNIPQVVHVHDLFQENDTAYIVMDFVKGQTLKAHLAQTGPLSWDAAKAIFFPAIQAMEQVHQAGLVHRDLSPDNLMLLPDGSVQILDLGAAKDLNVNTGASSMQVAKSGFSPLEQYSQRGSSGPWTDVYAMAATIYFSLTDVIPPNAVDRVDDDPIRWDLPQLASLPNGVLTALKQAMAVSAKMRTQSMGEFLAQLEWAQRQYIPNSTPKQPSKKKKFPLPMIAMVLTVALVAGCVLWLGTSTSLPDSNSTSQTKQTGTFPLPIGTQAIQQTIAAGEYQTVAVKKDGTVYATGFGLYDICDVSDWTDIVAVSTSSALTLGLKKDGTVVAAGSRISYHEELSKWDNIVAISTGGSRHSSGIVNDYYAYSYALGVRSDGTVEAAGSNRYGQCNVSDWTDIVAISAGVSHTVGLKTDGTVVATGENKNGQCDVSDWTDIVAINAGNTYTVGLKADGTVVTTDESEDVRCDVSKWTDIVAISVGRWHTVGLRADGTLVATGGNTHSQCDVSDWADIVAICAGEDYTVGLQADGTLVFAGNSSSTKLLAYWFNIRIPGSVN